MINLLPPQQIKELKEEENLRIILNLFILALLFLFSFFLILLSIKFYLMSILESQKTFLEKEEKILEVEKEIKNYNQTLVKINDFFEKKIFIFPKIEEFFEKIPNDILLSELEVKIDKKGEIYFSITAFSKTRSSLLEFIKTLKENYKEVSFSPEILLKEAEIDFSMSFKSK